MMDPEYFGYCFNLVVNGCFLISNPHYVFPIIYDSKRLCSLSTKVNRHFMTW